MGCTNLPPAVLNARIQITGNIADYVCQDGFEMTSGTQRATCVAANTWNFGTLPVCSIIDNTTYRSDLPEWVPIVVAVLLSFIVIICIIIVIVYCCCGPGRCCASKNRTNPAEKDFIDDGYYDDRDHYETKEYHGDGYYSDGYSYSGSHDGPYVIPVDYRKQQKIQNKEYVQYVVVEPQQQSKQKQPQRQPLQQQNKRGQPQKDVQNREYVQYVMVEPQQINKQKQQHQQQPQRVVTNSVVRSSVPNEDVVSLVKLTNGQFVPLHKYLQDNPGAKVTTVGDKDVVYLQDTGQRTETKPTPRHAWRANNKRTPPRPVVRSHTVSQPVVVTVMNDLTDEELAVEDKPLTTKRKAPPPHQYPQQQQPKPQPAPVIVTVPSPSAPGRATSVEPYIYKPIVKAQKEPAKRGKDTKSPDTKPDKETSNHSKDESDGSGETKVKDTASDVKDDDKERKDTSDSIEPVRATYVRSGTDLDTSLDSDVYITTPPHSTKHEIKRPAFTVRDYNRFRPAKDFPAWRPHAKPVRDNNTSTQ